MTTSLNIPVENIVTTMSWNDLTFAVINMTPAVATSLLKNNTNNRKLSPTVVEAYKADKSLGNWKFTGDPIRFHEDGTLLDGQHRCTGISQMDADYSEHVLCIFGLDDEAQFAMDQGKKRTAADQLQLSGHTNSAIVASVAKTTLVIEKGLLFQDRKKATPATTAAQIKEWADENPDKVAFIHEVSNDARQCHVAPSIVITAALIFREYDEEIAKDFVSKLRTGAGLEEGSAILAFRDRATRNKMNKRKDSDRDVLGLLIRTWNAHITGKKLSKLQLPPAKGGKPATFNQADFPEAILF